MQPTKQSHQLEVPIKFALLSHLLPSLHSVHGIMLERLLRGINPENYCIITAESRNKVFSSRPLGSQQPTYYNYLPAIRQWQNYNFSVIRFFGELIHRVRTVIRIIQRDDYNVLLAFTGDLLNLPIAWIVSRFAKVPFYVYSFDDYVSQWPSSKKRLFARYIAPLVMHRAAGIIVPNEFLQNAYISRYGVQPTLIHNPCESIARAPHLPWPFYSDEIRIIYSGSVYNAHYDTLQNLFSAIHELGNPKIKIHLYTHASPSDVSDSQLRENIIFHSPVSPSEMREIQRQADILFLPLAFKSFYSKELIRTSSPGKMGEYLASGRPILAHAPNNSFVSWYFKTYDTGKLLDQLNPHLLAKAIQHIISDPPQRQRWQQNALNRAQIDFKREMAQTKFLKFLCSSKKC